MGAVVLSIGSSKTFEKKKRVLVIELDSMIRKYKFYDRKHIFMTELEIFVCLFVYLLFFM